MGLPIFPRLGKGMACSSGTGFWAQALRPPGVGTGLSGQGKFIWNSMIWPQERTAHSDSLQMIFLFLKHRQWLGLKATKLREW